MKEPALCGKHNDTLARIRQQTLLARADSERLDGFKDRLRLEHHSLPTPEGTIIDGLMAILGESPQVVNFDIDQPLFARAAQYAVVERSTEKIGKNGDDVK